MRFEAHHGVTRNSRLSPCIAVLPVRNTARTAHESGVEPGHGSGAYADRVSFDEILRDIVLRRVPELATESAFPQGSLVAGPGSSQSCSSQPLSRYWLCVRSHRGTLSGYASAVRSVYGSLHVSLDLQRGSRRICVASVGSHSDNVVLGGFLGLNISLVVVFRMRALRNAKSAIQIEVDSQFVEILSPTR